MRPSTRLAVILGAGILLAASASFAVTNTVVRAGNDFFESKIRPVLVDNCYQCHSHQSEKVRGGLLLDTKDDVLRGGDSGPAIVPKHPEKSLLIKAVNYTDADLKMPPKDHKLTDAQIEDLRAWIKMGAPDPRLPGASYNSASLEAARKHWAFQPITEPPVPVFRKHGGWVKTPIDAFILENLLATNLMPSLPADKRTLIRRATFDLIGLPPKPEEVDAFLADDSSDAFAKVVDRLLASPHYGERWGRHWLDIARYSDTKGAVGGRENPRLPYAYAYRDYVIRSFNDDKPIDEFIKEQLAADQLNIGTNDNRALAAMGFLTVGRRFFDNENDIIDDRIDVVSRGLLGLTVTCARCHDHKFDPISTRDYYSLHGIFNSSMEPTNLPLLTEPLPAAYLNYLADVRTNQEALDKFVHSNEVVVLKMLRAHVGDYLLAVHDTKQWTGDNVKVDELIRARKLNKAVYLGWMTNLAKLETNQSRLFAPWKSIEGGSNQFNPAELNPMVAKELSDGSATNLKQAAESYNRIFANCETNLPEAAELREFAEAPKSPLNPVRADFMKDLLFDTATRSQIDTMQKKMVDIEATDPGAPPRAMLLVDKPLPANSHIFLRGNPGTRGAEAPREFLSVLEKSGEQPFPKQSSGRLQLAVDIASPQNPLTARVFVNRVWMHHFGESLVESPADFGVRTKLPLQAKLLDYMAARFMADGWSLKKLHRLIMLSSVYQQSSKWNAAYAQIDSENTRFWRVNPARIDFETMRDSLLSVAGDLDTAIGGQPVDIASTSNAQRRTVYSYIDRQNLPGVFRTFDFANPDTTSASRFESIVAPQALYLLNSPLVSKCARSLASQCATSAMTNEESAIDEVYRTLFQRKPTEGEVKIAEEYVREQPVRDVVVPETAAWQYGAARFDHVAQRTEDFHQLPIFKNGSWMPREKMPDPQLGSVQLSATGGFPGKASYAAVRRWTAPRDGVITISGNLSVQKSNDTIFARIVSSRDGTLGEWTSATTNFTPTATQSISVKEGDTIDFMAEAPTGEKPCNFKWVPHIQMEQNTADVIGLPCTWDARDNFVDPRKQPKPLGAWEKYAQVLLISNEFFYVE